MRIKSKVLAVVLCASMVLTCGCGKKETKKATAKKEITNLECVTLGDYSKISIKKSEIKSTLKSQIDSLLQQHATNKKVTKGTIKKNDTVNINYVGKVNGKKFEGGDLNKKDNPDGYNLTIGSGQFIPGFESGLIGKKVGQTVDVETKFPKKYPNSPKLAGKKAIFTVTINYIQGKQVIPKLTNAFVKKNLPSYKSVADYKAKSRQEIVENLAWEEVYKASKVTKYPSDRVNTMYKQLYSSISYYLQQNNYSLSAYAKAQNMTEDQLKAKLKSTAKEDVGKQIVYGAIAEKEKITVSDAEYKKELDSYIKNYNCKTEADLNKLFKQYYGTNAKEIIEDDVMFTNVKSFLVKNVVEK